MITYTQFKAKYPAGSSVASPEGTYRGECVSLVRTYMKEVDGFVSGPLGHAAQIPSNPTFLKAYEKVSSRKVGDLMFWGDDPGTWTSEFGHTAIYNGNDRMYNQNYNGSRVVSFNPIFTPGFIGYYRKKESKEMISKQGVQRITRFRLGRAAKATELSEWPKKYTEDQADTYVLGTQEHLNFIASVKASKAVPLRALSEPIRGVFGVK